MSALLLRSFKRDWLCLSLMVIVVSALPSVDVARAQAEPAGELVVVGEIALTKGVVTARSAQRELTALAKGSPVYLGDIIETAGRSLAIIQFTDGGKVTLRPDSRFDINEYDTTPGQEKESFALLKGGLRAVTGAIGKERPESVSYSARNTTIGIRGTTFIVKLCEEGVDGCDFSSTDPTQNDVTEVEAEKKFVDIFVVDTQGNTRERITRQRLQEMLEGVYVSVLDGAIRVSKGSWYIDMEAGDKCVIDYSDSGLVQRSSQEVECFVQTQGVEAIDVFLGPSAEKITLFNLFDDSEIYVGSEICEIN